MPNGTYGGVRGEAGDGFTYSINGPKMLTRSMAGEDEADASLPYPPIGRIVEPDQWSR